MQTLDLWMYLVVAMGSAIMGLLLLRSMGTASVSFALTDVAQRRDREAARRAENAAAEAAGRAAALEPLALNPDGTVEEPILGIVEPP